MPIDRQLPRQRRLPSGVSNATELLSVAEAADRLGVPVRFVRRLIAERRIRFYKVGRYVRIDRHDIDAFIEAGRVDPPQLWHR
jgi:excisionase family DNA binding protein